MISHGIEWQQIGVDERQCHQANRARNGLMCLERTAMYASAGHWQVPFTAYSKFGIDELLHQSIRFILRMIERIGTDAVQISLCKTAEDGKHLMQMCGLTVRL